MSNYTPRSNRESITREQDPAGRWSTKFPDMIGYKNQGGGKLPADFGWNTNPKQWQEEMTPETLAARYPRWDDAQAVRRRLDPDGTFANRYTDRVLGPVSASG